MKYYTSDFLNKENIYTLEKKWTTALLKNCLISLIFMNLLRIQTETPEKC
jgi:hypothetical protein